MSCSPPARNLGVLRQAVWLHHSQPRERKRAKKQSPQRSTTHLLKLICPFGPVRTVIPDVPVEPAVLGAGLVLEADGSVWFSVVLMATRYPSRGFATKKWSGATRARGGVERLEVLRIKFVWSRLENE
ncbi:nuclear pore complex protein An-Nup82 [Aspergillus luchuensis]|uniref:Nuclear pore complex protein An-Nup82 n=1 Tax=Aspergillus kawachii TaxID=1069201 RepID=A0A146FIM6_ASPKA|nr:nuclear pore complex protein An-Nup82 [Aspergillus luchuensis]